MNWKAGLAAMIAVVAIAFALLIPNAVKSEKIIGDDLDYSWSKSELQEVGLGDEVVFKIPKGWNESIETKNALDDEDAAGPTNRIFLCSDWLEAGSDNYFAYTDKGIRGFLGRQFPCYEKYGKAKITDIRISGFTWKKADIVNYVGDDKYNITQIYWKLGSCPKVGNIYYITLYCRGAEPMDDFKNLIANIKVNPVTEEDAKQKALNEDKLACWEAMKKLEEEKAQEDYEPEQDRFMP